MYFIFVLYRLKIANFTHSILIVDLQWRRSSARGLQSEYSGWNWQFSTYTNYVTSKNSMY